MKTFYKKGTYLLLLFTIQFTIAQNSIVFGNHEVSTKENFDFEISLNNTDEISAIQFDITFNNDAIELATGSQLTSRASSYTLGVSNPSPGVIRVLLYSGSNAGITGNTGDLLILKLKSKTLPGDFVLNYSNVVVSSPAGSAVTTAVQAGSTKVLGPLMNIATSSVGFGRVAMGDSPTKTVTIQNLGNLPLTLSSASTITPFSIQETFPFTINANSSRNLTLQIDSSIKYNSSTLLSFQNNDSNALRKLQNVTLSAVVYAVNEIKVGTGAGIINTEVEIPIVIENMEPFTGFQFDVQLPTGIEYVQSSIVTSSRFDGHAIGVSLIDGNKLRFIAYSGANKDFTGNTGEMFTFKLKPNVSSGNYSLIISDAIISNVNLGNVISDSYNGSIQINSPSLSLSPSSISYGNVPITETRQTSVRLTNTGSALLIIDQLTYNNEALNVDITLPLEIGVGNYSDVNILFTPKNIGAYSKSISFRHNGSSGQELLQVAATVFSPNFVMVEDKVAYRDQTNTFQILLKNNDAVRAVQFDLKLPTGFVMDINNLGTTTRTAGYSVYASVLNSTTYRVLLYANTNISIDPGDQSILSLPIHLDNSLSFGTYSFIFSNTIISDVNNQNISSVVLETGEITVKSKLTITADAKSKVYGEVDPALTYQITTGSLEAGDTLTGVLSRTTGEDVGSYAIASSLSNANYEITFVPADVTITKAAITITADAKSKVYGEVDPALTYVVSGFINTDTEASLDTPVSISRAAGEDVGSYAVTPSGAGDVNYTISFVAASFSITKASQSITFDSLTHTDDVFDLSATTTSGLEISYTSSDNSVATISGKTVTVLKAGSTTITASQNGNDNYHAATDVSQVLEIQVLGLGESILSNLKLYPNPTSNYLSIQGNDNPVTISIYNVLGKKVISAENTNKIDVKELSNGIYIIRIKEGLKEVIKKFIKE
jgi:hypothetical protein